MSRFVTFDILADAEPGLLPRIFVPLARRGLSADQVKARRHADAMHVLVALEMPEEEIHLVEGNLRSVIGVRRIEVTLHASMRAA